MTMAVLWSAVATFAASLAAGMSIAVGLLGPQWHAFSGDIGERVTFWSVAFFGSVFTGAVGLLPLAILIVLAEAFKIRSLLINTAVGAALLVAGKAKSLQEGVALAAGAIDSGKALAVLERLVALSHAKV